MEIDIAMATTVATVLGVGATVAAGVGALCEAAETVEGGITTTTRRVALTLLCEAPEVVETTTEHEATLTKHRLRAPVAGHLPAESDDKGGTHKLDVPTDRSLLLTLSITSNLELGLKQSLLVAV